MSVERVVVAHFRMANAYMMIFRLAMVFPFSGLLMYISYHYGFLVHPNSSNTQVYFPLFVVAFVIAVSLGFFLEFLFIFSVFFDKRRALWIQDGRVIYLHRLMLSQRSNEIASVTPGTWFSRPLKLRKYESIVLTLHSGRERHITCNDFAERRDEIIQALKRKLGI